MLCITRDYYEPMGKRAHHRRRRHRHQFHGFFSVYSMYSEWDCERATI